MAGTTDFEVFYYLRKHEGRGRVGLDDEDEEDSSFFLGAGTGLAEQCQEHRAKRAEQ